jgi:GAF domain-containing protein
MPEPGQAATRILFVDDADDFRQPIAELLRLDYDYVVNEAGNAPDALGLICGSYSPYHVALIDQVLGEDMDGIELMQAMRVEQPHLDVILLTGYGLEPRPDALQAGAYRFLQKPVTLDLLHQMIDMCVETQRARTALESAQRDRALLETLLQLSQVMGASLDQSEILEATYVHLGRLMDVSCMNIALLNKREGVLRFPLRCSEGCFIESSPRSFSYSDDKRGITDWVIRHRAPLLILDRSRDLTPVPPVIVGSGWVSWLGVPLLVTGHAIGAITVQSSLPNHYDSTDQRILMAVANHVAQALDNARLYRELDVLHQISQRIVSVDDLNDLLEAITEEAAQLVNTRNIRIGLYRPTRKEVDLLIRYEEGERLPFLTLPATRGLVGYTIRSGKPVLLCNREENRKLKAQVGLQTEGRLSRSWLSVPLLTEGPEAIGAIAVQDYERESAFDEHDQEILSRLGNYVAVAVHKAQLLARVRRGLRQRSTLYEITTLLRPEQGLGREDVLWTFLTGVTAGYGLGFNRAVLLRWEPDADRDADHGWLTGWMGIGDLDLDTAEKTWERMQCLGIDSLESFLKLPRAEFGDTPVNRILQSVHIEVGSESAGGFSWAVFHRQAIVVSGRSPFLDAKPFLQAFDPAEFVIVPLDVSGQLIGVLVVDNKFTREPIDHRSLNLLVTFADVVMKALENAELRQELERRIWVLRRHYEVATALRTMPDQSESIGLVVQVLQELYQLDTCTFGRLDASGKRLVFEHQVGLPERTERFVAQIPKGYWDRLRESDEPIVIPELSKAPGVCDILVRSDLRSFVVVPVRDTREQLRGILTLGRCGPLTIRPEDHETLKALAGQVALAIRNAELFQEVRRRTQIQERLLSIGQKITGAVAEENRDVLTEIASGALDLMDADCVVVYPYLPEGRRYDLRHITTVGLISGREPREFSDKERTEASMTDVVLRKESVIVDNVSSGWDREGKVNIRCGPGSFLQREAIQAFVGVSMLTSNQPVGALFVNMRHPHTFRQDELLTIQTFAAQAAIAIEKDRLVHRVESLLDSQIRAIDGLQKASELVSLLESPLQEVWQAVLDSAVVVSGADRGWFHVVEKPTGELLPVSTRNVPEQTQANLGNAILDKRGVTGWVAKHRKTAKIGDVQNDPVWTEWYVHAVESTQSEMAVPILLGPEQELVGIIDLESDQKYAFSEDKQKLVEALAPAAAVAYHNASLYRQAEQGRQYLEAQFKAAKAINASLDRNATLNRILAEAVNLTEVEGERAHFGSIRLWDESSSELVITNVYRSKDDPPSRGHQLGDRLPLPEGMLLPDGTRRTGITGRVALTKKSANVPNVAGDDDYLEYCQGTCSELAVPLVAGERLIGVLNVEHRNERVFDENDVTALEALAEYAVIAILNAETYGELERRRQELDEKKSELAATAAVAWAGIMGSTLAHDIRGYAAAIRNSLQEVKGKLCGKPTEQRLIAPIQDMSSASERIERLARQLSLSPEEGADRVDVHCLLTERLADWQRLYRKEDVTWQLELDPDATSPLVEVNRLSLIVALDQLVDNSVEAMRKQPQQVLTIRTRGGNQRLEIDLIDTGPGISREFIPRLFKERVPQKPCEKGSGIGLLIVNVIMRGFGGGVCLTDTGPQGTTFTLWLPLEN